MLLILGYQIKMKKYIKFNSKKAFSISCWNRFQYQLVDIRIFGLQFINNAYNIVGRNNANSTFLTPYSLNLLNTNSAGLLTPMFNPLILTFGQSADYVDITVDIKCTKDQKYPEIVVNTALGHFTFMFKIYGIPTKPQNLITNGSRM